MASLQNITFAQLPPANVNRIRVRFEYSDDDQQTWNAFAYTIPEDMFDIREEDRERIAIELIYAIALGKGHIDEEGNVLVGG